MVVTLILPNIDLQNRLLQAFLTTIYLISCLFYTVRLLDTPDYITFLFSHSTVRVLMAEYLS